MIVIPFRNIREIDGGINKKIGRIKREKEEGENKKKIKRRKYKIEDTVERR